MKKTLIFGIGLILMIAFSSESFAQPVFGLKGGLNLSKIMMKEGEIDFSDMADMVAGFHFGPVVELPLGKMFAVESGVILNTKGYKFEEDSYEESVSLFYADIPVLAKVYIGAAGIRIFGQAGPDFGVAISGKQKWSSGNESGDESIEFGSDDDSDLKRMDVGLQVGAGVAVKNLQVSVSYNLGLQNLIPDDDYTMKNRVIGVSLAYRFGGK